MRDTGVADMYARTVKPDFALSKVVYKKCNPCLRYLNATIDVPIDKVSPTEISAELSNNIKEAIEQHTGLPIKITITQPEK